MSTDYSPTTAEIRNRHNGAAGDIDEKIELDQIFGRWLAAHDAEVLATVRPNPDDALAEMIEERDEWQERLTNLCYSLATVEEIGEWSSHNELDDALIDHMQGKIQRLERAQPSPADARQVEVVTRALCHQCSLDPDGCAGDWESCPYWRDHTRDARAVLTALAAMGGERA